MKEIKLREKRTVRITSGSEDQTLEIGKNTIDSGLLNELTGPSLAVFIYLATHLDKKNSVKLDLSLISNKISYDIQDIKKGLEILNQKNFIDMKRQDNKYLTFSIRFKPGKDTSSFSENITPPVDGAAYRKDIIKKQHITKTQLIKAFLSFIPSNKKPDSFKKEFNKWLNDFEPNLLQELIRRVDKWLSRNNNSSTREGFYYLKGIINDWYKKEIFTSKKLRYFDRLFRETRELARSYGIKWKNISPSQLETFRSWLTEDFALSKPVVQFAIQEATKRKSNGQPSLKYIEDNFIIPWKDAGIKNVKEARHYLNSTKRNKNKKQQTDKSFSDLAQKEWDKFYWDF